MTRRLSLTGEAGLVHRLRPEARPPIGRVPCRVRALAFGSGLAVAASGMVVAIRRDPSRGPNPLGFPGHAVLRRHLVGLARALQRQRAALEGVALVDALG